MEVIGFIAIVAIFVFIITMRGKAKVATQSFGPRYVRLEGDGDYELDVVGESHYQDALSAIVGGKTEDGHEYDCEAELRREPDNQHDKTAIAVYIEDMKVGYLSRAHAKRLTAILTSKSLDGGVADALIVGGWSRRDDEGHFGVKLDIPI